MTVDEMVPDLLKIIDKLLNLLTLQTGAEFVFDGAEADGDEEQVKYDDDRIAGYAVNNTWELEDELVRDPVLPDIGDPEE